MNYHRPKVLADCLSLLAERSLCIVAGATDIIPLRSAKRAAGVWREPDYLDITAIDGLKQIHHRADGTHIGALVTWRALQNTPLAPAFDALKMASGEVGGAQVQSRATLVGNLCNASPAADGVPPLLCLNAEVVLQSLSGERRLPLSEFIQGNRKIQRRSEELVTALVIPPQEKARASAFKKLGARSHLVISQASLAASWCFNDAGAFKDVRLAVGACSAVPQRLNGLEAAINGQIPSPALWALLDDDHYFSTLSPIDDIRASAQWRRRAVKTLLKRCLPLAKEPN